MESKDKRKGWLRNLKVGDEVILVSPHSSELLGRIDKITPTGKMTVRNWIFNPAGFHEGAGNYRVTYLRQPTPEKVALIKRRELIQAVSSTRWNILSTETLETIQETIKKETDKTLYEILKEDDND